MGVSPCPAARPNHLPAIHTLGEHRSSRLQTGRLESGVLAVGPAQEEAGYELRNYGQSPAVRFCVKCAEKILRAAL